MLVSDLTIEQFFSVIFYATFLAIIFGSSMIGAFKASMKIVNDLSDFTFKFINKIFKKKNKLESDFK